MRCKTCEYPLWQIRDRMCPECGGPFRPSEFEFVKNSVRFCCPHCGQDYYGTGERGHLVPASFACVKCRRSVTMDEMVLLPTEGVAEERTRAETMPWLERSRIGAIRGWWKTVWMGIARPTALIRLTPIEGSAGSAWWFATLTLLACLGLALGPAIALGIVLNATGPGPGGVGFAAAMVLVLFFAAALVLMTLWALVCHLILRLTGPVRGGLGRTFQSICYGAGTMLVASIPCIGVYLFWAGALWWAIAAIYMVKEGQGVRGWRATAAALTFPVLVLLAGAGLYAGVIATVLFRARAAATTAVGATQLNQVQAVQSAIRDYVGTTGAYPGHGIELVTRGMLAPTDLVSVASSSSTLTARVAGMSLDRFMLMDEQKQALAATAAAGALPPGTIAHRIGDVVFTYHGMDASPGDPGLWLFIVSPDPAVGGTPGPVWAGRARGTMDLIEPERMAAALQEQNSRRAAAGLAPLPDPATITHNAPAVGGE